MQMLQSQKAQIHFRQGGAPKFIQISIKISIAPIKKFSSPASRNIHKILNLQNCEKWPRCVFPLLGVSPSIEDCLESLRVYDFLWQQDLHSSYKLFLSSQPQIETCSSQVQNFMELEEKIEGIPSIFSVGPLQLSAKPVKNSLKALAVSWKMEFATFIHKQAKVC